MSRGSRAFLVFILIAVHLWIGPFGSARIGTALAQERVCGNPALLAWAAPAEGDLPPAETTVLPIDGSEPLHLAIDRPELASSNSVLSRALVRGQDGSLQIVDIATGEIIPVFQPESVGDGASPAPREIRAPADSPWMPFSDGDNVSLVNLATGTIVPVTIRLADIFGMSPVTERSLSPDGQWIAANERGVLQIGPVESNEPFQVISKGEHPWSTAFAFAPSSKLIAWAPSDLEPVQNALWVRDLQTGEESLVADGRPSSGVTSLLFADDSTLLWARDNELEIHDLATGTSQTYLLPDQYPQLWAVSPDERQVLLSGAAGYFVFDLGSGNVTMVDGLNGMYLIAWPDGGNRLYFQGQVSAAMFDWSAGPAAVQPIPFSSGFSSADVSRDGATSVWTGAGNAAATVQIVDLAGGTSATYQAKEAPTVVSVSPDGCSVGIGTFHVEDKVRYAEITVVDLSGSVVQTFPGYVLAGWVPRAA